MACCKVDFTLSNPLNFDVLTSRAVRECGTWLPVLQMFLRADEGFVALADQLVGAVVELRTVAVDHVPVVADHHALLEEGRVGTRVCEPATFQVAHVVQLATVQSEHVVQLATVQSEHVSVNVDWHATPCTYRWDLPSPSS